MKNTVIFSSTKEFLSTQDANNAENLLENKEALFVHEKKDKGILEALLKAEVPKQSHFIGQAKGQGDCFFDAIAQALNAREGKEVYGVKSLRLLCDEYAKNPSRNDWVEKAVKADGDDYFQYLTRIAFTVEEMAEHEKNQTLTGTATWGRPTIEGRMICETYDIIKIHVMELRAEAQDEQGHVVHPAMVTHLLVSKEGSQDIEAEAINYAAEDTLHLAVGNLHFVPILPQASKATQQKGHGHEKIEGLGKASSTVKINPQIFTQSFTFLERIINTFSITVVYANPDTIKKILNYIINCNYAALKEDNSLRDNLPDIIGAALDDLCALYEELSSLDMLAFLKTINDVAFITIKFMQTTAQEAEKENAVSSESEETPKGWIWKGVYNALDAAKKNIGNDMLEKGLDKAKSMVKEIDKSDQQHPTKNMELTEYATYQTKQVFLGAKDSLWGTVSLLKTVGSAALHPVEASKSIDKGARFLATKVEEAKQDPKAALKDAVGFVSTLGIEGVKNAYNNPVRAASGYATSIATGKLASAAVKSIKSNQLIKKASDSMKKTISDVAGLSEAEKTYKLTQDSYSTLKNTAQTTKEQVSTLSEKMKLVQKATKEIAADPIGFNKLNSIESFIDANMAEPEKLAEFMRDTLKLQPDVLAMDQAIYVPRQLQAAEQASQMVGAQLKQTKLILNHSQQQVSNLQKYILPVHKAVDICENNLQDHLNTLVINKDGKIRVDEKKIVNAFVMAWMEQFISIRNSQLPAEQRMKTCVDMFLSFAEKIIQLRHVKFTYSPQAPLPQETIIHLAGSFNNWLNAEGGIIYPTDTSWSMSWQNGQWTNEVQLPSGNYVCKVVINSENWFPAENQLINIQSAPEPGERLAQIIRL